MIPRHAAATLRALARHYPVVALTGPRQSGKSTLARAVFPGLPYASLEDLDLREFATSDPRGFLAQYSDGAVFDEAQRAPQLFSYLQTKVDRDRRAGRFVLTGSQQFGLLAGISQSLAGRVGLVHLLPFSLGELPRARRPKDLETLLWSGLYPPVIDRAVPPLQWYGDYLATYVERDARSLVNVRELGTFRRFVRMCAARTAQSLNLSALAADCGVTHNTARAWISVLEASYIVFLLPPHHRNFGKRLVKTPKLYFYDTGLAARLLGMQSPGELAIGPARGPLFETWVVAEFLKRRCHLGLAPELHFWRDSAGGEIDIVVDRAGALFPVEAKAGRTIAADWLAPLERFLALSGARAGALVFGGEGTRRRGSVEVAGWREIGTVLEAALPAPKQGS
jgi:predicted AAA+ superfamily ATPase